MDPIQMGKFLAQLRREAGLTQQALGEALGVTNKTVSRWENGNYLPDLDMLQLLGARFSVSVDELIQGARLPAARAPEPTRTDPPAGAAAAPDPFTLAQRIAYWKRKWLREHLPLLLLYAAGCCLLPLAAWRTGLVREPPLLVGGCAVLALAAFLTLRNRMMIYVEARAFAPNERRR